MTKKKTTQTKPTTTAKPAGAMPPVRVQMNVRMPQTMAEELRELARMGGVDLGWVVERAMDRGLAAVRESLASIQASFKVVK